MLHLILAAVLLAFTPAAYATDAAQTEANKMTAFEFYHLAINQKNFDAAAKFLGRRYTRDNPIVADGAQGLKALLAILRKKFSESHNEIKRVFARDDCVTLHVHSVRTPSMRGFALVDMFKLENGKIVEHWDLRQEIPKQSVNSNTMF